MGDPPKWKVHPTIDNYGKTCIICGRPQPGLNMRQVQPAQSPLITTRVVGVAAILAALVGIGIWWRWQSPAIPFGIPVANSSASANSAPVASSSDRFSSGEQRLLRYQANSDGEAGAKAFAAGNYQDAFKWFNRAIQGDRKDPEVDIYRNNAQARLADLEPFKLAVVVPIDSASTSAEELLRGVADAQGQFNRAGGFKGRLLEIVIVNDGNDPRVSAAVAQEIANDRTIIGVIGHNASAASKAALPIYQRANLPMVSPSLSTELSGKVFFRATLSVEVLGNHLAEYARNKLGLSAIASFYNPNDSFSMSVQTTFAKRFQELGGKVVQAIDLTASDFDPVVALRDLQGKVAAIALFPDTQYTTVAISLAKANRQLPGGQRLKLLGTTTLYRPSTLTAGGPAVEGLTLSIPWFARTSYARQAGQRWGGQISWRTATTYDATLAFIKSFSDNASRESVLKNLPAVNVPAAQTSGEVLRFSANGERSGEPLLVQAVRSAGGPASSGLSFKLIE
jgi:branched-chain amino acid transport system substrate-binding protein